MDEPEAVQATARGAFVPEAVSGRVLSVHAAAVNVLDEPSGLLVSLLLREADMTGMAVLVPRFPGGIAPGDAVSGAGLRVSGRGRVSLDGAVVWEGRPVSRPALGRARVGSVAAALRSCGVPGGFLGVIVPTDTNPFGAKARALLRGASAAAASGFEGGLVGLGPGFTPSGDDFLAGALLAEECVGGARGRPIDRESVGLGLSRTTPGGRTLLTLALRGSYPAYLLRFLARLDASRSAEDVRAAVREAVAHGETSGTDALLGFVWRAGGIP